MTPLILVVDDDELLRRSVAYHLEKAGFRVQVTETAEQGLLIARATPPDLILLDINLPGMDGLSALRQFREELDIPILFVTARQREIDEVLGLEMGANDYITKPFDKDVLIARIRSALRTAAGGQRPLAETTTHIQVGDLVLVPEEHKVAVGEREVDLSPREYRLLRALAENTGRVISIDDLLNQAWGPEFAGQLQVVYVHIRWLREKIERDPQNPQRILTVRGVGYKLVSPEV